MEADTQKNKPLSDGEITGLVSLYRSARGSLPEANRGLVQAQLIPGLGMTPECRAFITAMQQNMHALLQTAVCYRDMVRVLEQQRA